MDKKTTSHISLANRNAHLPFKERRKYDRRHRRSTETTKHKEGDGYVSELEDLHPSDNYNTNADFQHNVEYHSTNYYDTDKHYYDENNQYYDENNQYYDANKRYYDADNELEYGHNTDYYHGDNYPEHYEADYDFGYNDYNYDANNKMGYNYDANNKMGYDYDANNKMGYDYDANNKMGYDYDANNKTGYDYDVKDPMGNQYDYNYDYDVGSGAQDDDRGGYDNWQINTDDAAYGTHNYERTDVLEENKHDITADIRYNVGDENQDYDERPEDQAYRIEDDNELLLPEGDLKSKEKVPCSWCPDGPCRTIGKHIYNFFTGPPDSYAPIKTALGFPFGFIIAYGLYHALIEPMMFSKEIKEVIGAVMVLGIACGYALSVQIRCMICLVVPTFFGKTGRSYIGTFAIAYLIAGPVNNILLNCKEITRSLSCSAELSANHTRAKWELKMRPLEDAMHAYQTEGLYMKKVVKRLNKEFTPMKTEVRDVREVKFLQSQTHSVDGLSGGKRGNRAFRIMSRNRYSNKDARKRQIEKRYRTKLDLQCESVWNEGVLRCRRKFHDLEARCLAAIPFIGYLLCLPLKMTFFCELVRLIPGAIGMSCDSLDVIEPGFGETYVASEDMVNTMDENFEVNLQYKLVHDKEGLDMTTAEEIRKGTMHEFERRQKWIEWCMEILSRLLAFTFIRIIISAYSYNKKFLADFSFDNIYISSYFEHIDKRRKRQGKNGLLPLKKSERCGLVYPWSPKIMKVERKKLSKGTFMLLMRAFVSFVIIYSDYLLWTVMDIIRRHSRVDYAQYGKHHIKVKVHGIGFLSNIVRMFVRSFDSKHTLDKVTTNYGCLPNPIGLERKYIYYIYSFYAAVWFLMFVESYGLRLRRVIASFFYRKREKSRILFLYNDLYKKRKGYTRHIRHEVRRQARKRTLSKKTGLLSSFRKEFPRCCGWLKMFDCGRDTCIICNDPAGDTYIKCDTPDCPFGYCFDCWKDVKVKITEKDKTEQDAVNIKTALNMTLVCFGSALFINYIAEIVQLSDYLNVNDKHIAVVGSIVLCSAAIAMILLYALAYMFTKKGHEQGTMILFVVAFSCLSVAISALGIVISSTS